MTWWIVGITLGIIVLRIAYIVFLEEPAQIPYKDYKKNQEDSQ